VLEGTPLDVACLAQRQSQFTRRVRQIVRVAVGQPHAQLEHLALGLGQTAEHLLQRARELCRGLVGLPLATAVLALGALAALALTTLTAVLAAFALATVLTALATAPLALAALALATVLTALATTAPTTTLGGGRVTGALIGGHGAEPNGSACRDGPRMLAPTHASEVAPFRSPDVRRSTPAVIDGASMPFVLAVVALGVVLSYARGGRLRRAGQAPLYWRSLLFLGVAIQVTVDALAAREVLGDATTLGWLLLLLSQLLVVGFLIANRQLPGVFLVAGGLALNAVVMAANGAMPVDPAAIQALGLGDVEVPLGKHTLLDDATRLPWLADIIPLPPLRSIISVGDLVLAAGIVPLTHALMTHRTPAEQPGHHDATDQA